LINPVTNFIIKFEDEFIHFTQDLIQTASNHYLRIRGKFFCLESSQSNCLIEVQIIKAIIKNSGTKVIRLLEEGRSSVENHWKSVLIRSLYVVSSKESRNVQTRFLTIQRFSWFNCLNFLFKNFDKELTKSFLGHQLFFQRRKSSLLKGILLVVSIKTCYSWMKRWSILPKEIGDFNLKNRSVYSKELID